MTRIDRAKARDAALGAVLTLLALGWLLGTPYLAYGALITSAPFFGEQASAAEMRTAGQLMLGALACGVLLPLVGLCLASAVRWKAVAVGFAVALVVSLMAGVMLAVAPG